MGTEFGDDVQYSPWTDDKPRLWSNSGADPPRDGFTNGGWFDINVVINEEEFFRTWVDDHAIGTGGTNTQVLQGQYTYENGAFPRGYRFLNEGTGIFADAATDLNGVLFEDRLVG